MIDPVRGAAVVIVIGRGKGRLVRVMQGVMQEGKVLRPAKSVESGLKFCRRGAV